MNRQSRLDSILELLIQDGSLDVDETARILQVSSATIRRDFDRLAEQQLLNRTHGGALATGGSFRLPLTYKIAREEDAKRRIAETAAQMVSRHQVIGLNGGTTTTEVARALAASPEFAAGEVGDPPALTVVTNALNIATELTVRHHIKIVVTGGVARPQSYELTGPHAEQVLSDVVIDIAFVGVEGLDPKIGATAGHEEEARVNQQIASRAQQVVIVADSSKFERSAFAMIRTPEQIDTIITDNGISVDTRKILEHAGVKIVIA
jgi:DeoR family transcriptional regulator, aga operon transcriptional repressor